MCPQAHNPPIQNLLPPVHKLSPFTHFSIPQETIRSFYSTALWSSQNRNLTDSNLSVFYTLKTSTGGSPSDSSPWATWSSYRRLHPQRKTDCGRRRLGTHPDPADHGHACLGGTGADRSGDPDDERGAGLGADQSGRSGGGRGVGSGSVRDVRAGGRDREGRGGRGCGGARLRP